MVFRQIWESVQNVPKKLLGFWIQGLNDLDLSFMMAPRLDLLEC